MNVPESQSATPFDLETLAQSILKLSDELSRQASRAVNLSLTARNWLIGQYIAEYELHGADRATYGDKLFVQLAARLTDLKVKTCDKRRLYLYLQFYIAYPEIARSLSAQSQKLLLSSPLTEHAEQKVRTPSAQFDPGVMESLSYSHFELLVGVKEEAKRKFYESECIKGCWSVRELKRQIGSLLYDRSQLSLDQQKLTELTEKTSERAKVSLSIRDPYIFEFLGLTPQEVMSESHLEHQLLDRLQNFLLELGQGFCFEARQRRILIGETYNFVDMVFYHRILKCHILLELKLEEFSHENIGQLNTYVSWYNENVRTADDNPPVGILLCTEKDHALVKYALAGMDNSLFVSKYQLELPSQELLQQQLETERQRLKGTE